MTKSKAREILDKDKKYILWLYDERCVVCGKRTNIIHEIIPISHGRSSLRPKNRVTLCQKHHEWAHESTVESILILQEKRYEFLVKKFGLVD